MLCVHGLPNLSFFQATDIKLHPLYVILPCTLCASMAFMLSVSTPPNAIAFFFGNLKVMDMVRTEDGPLFLSFHCICCF